MYVKGSGHEHTGPGTSLTLLAPPNYRVGGMTGCAGMGGCGCGGACGGLGLFESGADFTAWGWPEWGLVLVGGYMLLSTVFTTGRAVSRVRALPGERRKARAARLRREASELTKRR